MGGLRNPPPSRGRDVFHAVPCRKQAKRIAELEEELAKKSREGEGQKPVLEVVREVVKEDASLIAQLNDAHKEVVRLRGLIQERPPIARMPQAVQTIEKEVVREVIRIKRELNKKLLAAAVAGSLLAGACGGYLVKKERVIQAPVISAPQKR